jgi:MFS family permease
LIIGSSCLGDIYAPVERGTALGWFLSGALVGPAFGPFIGGIIVTFRTWRAIFWLQSALGGLATMLVLFLLPETIPRKKMDDFREIGRVQRIKKIAHLVNPLRVAILLFEYPNLIIAGIASSSLVWNMYSLLTPIRYVLNPRFHLTSPIQSGLFYIAPGCGYLLGSFFGGRWADHIVKKWVKKRGRRVPEDRLRSCLSSHGTRHTRLHYHLRMECREKSWRSAITGASNVCPGSRATVLLPESQHILPRRDASKRAVGRSCSR